jgi:methionine-R-sulfoxide reductase
MHGTEPPFGGKLLHNRERGTYACAACGNELFSSEEKFDSDCGWPAFYDAAAKGSVKTKADLSHGMARTEVLCGRCGSHLGHVFDEPTRTGKRFCINSLALDFKKAEKNGNREDNKKT